MINRPPHPWELRRKRIHDMVDLYLQSFYLSDTWHRAIAEKWDCYLLPFIKSVAEIQAHLIVDEKRPFPWDGDKVFGHKIPDESTVNQFMGRQRTQAGMGFVDVPIPVDAIARWKAML